MEFWPITTRRRKTSATKKKKPPADARFAVLQKPGKVVRAYPKEGKRGEYYYKKKGSDGKYKNVSLRPSQKTVNSVETARKKLAALKKPTKKATTTTTKKKAKR